MVLSDGAADKERMRTYVSTLGYHSTRVTRPVLRHGIDDDDVVVLIRPAIENDSTRAQETIEDVRQLANEIAPAVTVEVERIPVEEFDEAVRTCLDVLDAATGRLVVNFDGGPRELFLPFTVATLVRVDRVDSILQFCDIDSQVRELYLPRLVTAPSPSAMATLRLLTALEGEATLPKLAAESDRSKSTLGRHLSDLEDQGLVETELHGKTRHARVTLAGELRIRGLGE
jgi:CRISPR-associated protein Csa3